MSVHFGGRGPGHMSRSMGGLNPLSLFAGGLKGVWYDPSDLATVWQDSGRTTPGVVGQPVGCIDDKSGNGYNAIQATAGSRPILRNSGTLYWLEFDGVDDFLASNATVDLTASNEVSAFIGLRKTSDATTQVVLENTTAAGSFRVYVPTGLTNYIYGAGGTTPIDVNATGLAAPNTAVISGQTKISTPISTIRVNGVQRATTGTPLGTGNMGNYTLYLGRRNGTTLPFAGNVYGVIVVGSLVASPTATETWLNGKTGAY